MKTAVIRIAAFACLLGLVMSLPGTDQFLDPECGIRAPHRSKRVINGTVADMTSSPWMVFLHANGRWMGAGTLITNRLVLTAAYIAKLENNITARLGEYWRSRESQCYGSFCTEREFHQVEMSIKHPHYNPETNANDIAILLLRNAVVYKANIRPICIVRNTPEWKRALNDIQTLTGTGWGKTEKDYDSDELRTLDVRRQPPAVCAESVGPINVNNQFCAGSPTSSMCYGDDGGPVGAIVATTKGERFVQIGIAAVTNLKCQKAAVFTDVLSHMDFILRVWRQYGSSV